MSDVNDADFRYWMFSSSHILIYNIIFQFENARQILFAALFADCFVYHPVSMEDILNPLVWLNLNGIPQIKNSIVAIFMAIELSLE